MSPADHTPPSTKPVCILVVDDQPTNIRIAGTVLGQLGYEIIPASDGPTALKRLALQLPDLILLDLLMPGMDGFEVCRQIQAHPIWRELPVIFLSAADDKELIVRALESGGIDYITKPFTRGELISRVKTQVALKQTRDRLFRLAEDKDELLGILAHDLKNHLGGMQMSAQLLQTRMEDLGDSRATQLSDNILRSTSQLLAFVKEFLANASADHGMSLHCVSLQLSEAAARTVEQHREAARRKQIVLELTVPNGETLIVADALALDQILDNLVSNALKFSPTGGRVSLAITSQATSVACSIQDFGPGFTEEDFNRMFRRYGRLSARPTAGEPSTGLGLSIVRKLVEALKGELVCENIPGAGAKFTVRFPRPTI